METQNEREIDSIKAGPTQSEAQAESKKPSMLKRTITRLGWLAGGLADWFGSKSVGAGAGLVGKLWNQTRKGPQFDNRFKLDDVGEFDLQATAFSRGVTVEVLQHRLERRQRMTMLVSYGAFSIAFMSIIFWIRSAVLEPYTLGRVITAVRFLPFISLFLLLAFYNALLNYQIRSCQPAGWREFLSTEQGFLPR